MAEKLDNEIIENFLSDLVTSLREINQEIDYYEDENASEIHDNKNRSLEDWEQNAANMLNWINGESL